MGYTFRELVEMPRAEFARLQRVVAYGAIALPHVRAPEPVLDPRGPRSNGILLEELLGTVDGPFLEIDVSVG